MSPCLASPARLTFLLFARVWHLQIGGFLTWTYGGSLGLWSGASSLVALSLCRYAVGSLATLPRCFRCSAQQHVACTPLRAHACAQWRPQILSRGRGRVVWPPLEQSELGFLCVRALAAGSHPRRGARPHASARAPDVATVVSATRFILAAPLSTGSSGARWRSRPSSPRTQPHRCACPLPRAPPACSARALRPRACQ